MIPTTNRPPDFHAFWQDTLQKLWAIDPMLERQVLQSQTAPSGMVLERVRFRSWNGVTIRGYHMYHPDPSTPRPLIVHSHGYNSQYTMKPEWVAGGADVLGIDIRGFGRSHQGVERSPLGWVLTHCHSPEQSILRGAVCDQIQAIRVGLSIPPTQGRRLVHWGYSFGGGLAMMAETLYSHAEALVVGVPTFGWPLGRQLLVRQGSGEEINRYLVQQPEAEEDLMMVLRYFDPINFAPDLKLPVLMGYGEEDDVVPAETVLPIAANLTCRHEVERYPVSHTDRPEEIEWNKFRAKCLHFAVHGVPDTFGR
ncbi:acetylxylan esterase [Magnetococcus sp. PR-3]|uniref:acetylxylan esterase n=1 Tax=Magnetococcus sp. PR-3 TaxID=3120355 RepID=UPI002FCE0E9F